MDSMYIRNRLADNGLDYTCIAKRHSTSAHYVSVVVQRWAGRASGAPRGLTRLLLVDISKEIGEAISPTINHLINGAVSNDNQRQTLAANVCT